MSEGEALKIESAVSEADLKLIETMSKDSLESYVKQHFSIDMDKRIKASQLRADATEMVKDHLGLNEPEVKKTEVKKSKQPAALEFIKNPHDGNPYPDWERCDSSGKLI